MTTRAEKMKSIDDEIAANDNVLFGWVAAIFFTVVCGGIWGYEKWSSTVTGHQSVGDVVAVEFSGASTVVKTTKGTFRVVGRFQALNGGSLAIQTYKNSPKALCDTSGDFCRALSD